MHSWEQGAHFLPLLSGLVRMSGADSDVAMNSIVNKQDSELLGANRRDRPQRRSIHCELHSGSAARAKRPNLQSGRAPVLAAASLNISTATS